MSTKRKMRVLIEKGNIDENNEKKFKIDEGYKRSNEGTKMTEGAKIPEGLKSLEGVKMPEGDGDDGFQLTEEIFQQVLYTFCYMMK